MWKTAQARDTLGENPGGNGQRDARSNRVAEPQSAVSQVFSLRGALCALKALLICAVCRLQIFATERVLSESSLMLTRCACRR